MANRMWIGNIDRCWEVIQEVWRRRDAAEAAQMTKKEKSRPAMVYAENAKRKFQEMGMDGFEEMNPKRQRMSFSGSPPAPERRRIHEPVEEGMERDLTIRGKLHWVGVMKDWEWESKYIHPPLQNK